MSSIIQPFNDETAKNASALLAAGKLICFPTETVYALAGDATSDKAVASIYKTKQRNMLKPLALLLHSISQVKAFCEVDMLAAFLLSVFAPGPLTLILPLKKDHPLSPLLHPDMESIGVRIPNHPIALEILRSVPFPVTATSANLTGNKPAGSAQEAADILDNQVSLFIEGVEGASGIASTVIDLTQSPPKLLREGGISRNTLNKVIGEEVL